jgi:hypothetical protein
VDLRSPSIARDHQEREAPLRHHINPEPRSRLLDQLDTAAELVDVTTGGIGRAAGLTPFGAAETICGQRG